MKPTVIYVRVSSKSQKEEGYSIPAQKKLLSDFAKMNGFRIVKSFEDDETAKSEGRAGFGEMVEFLKNDKRKIDTVLVEKTDRLYRNFKDYITIDDLGVTVFLVKENEKIGKDASSHQKFIHGIKVLMAKNYIDNLSEEAKKGLKQKAESGIYPCNTLPLGYIRKKIDGKSYPIIDKKNKDLVVKIFEHYATGLYSIERLLNKIDEEGLIIPANFPKSSKLSALRKSTLHGILRNPFYYGDFYWKGSLYRGKHKPLIDRELWEKTQNVLDRFQNKKMSSKYNTLKFTFRGLLKCEECGRTITGVRKIKPSGKKYTYYGCTKYKTDCSQKPVTEKELNEQIKSLLEGLKFPPEGIEYIRLGLKQSLQSKNNFEDKIKERLEKNKKDSEKQFKVLYGDRLDGTISKKFYKEQSKMLEKKIKKLENKINRYTKADIDYYKTGSEILELSQKAAILYKEATIEEKQRLLSFLLQNATLKDKELHVEYKKPFDKIYQRALCSDERGRPDSNRQPLP